MCILIMENIIDYIFGSLCWYVMELTLGFNLLYNEVFSVRGISEELSISCLILYYICFSGIMDKRVWLLLINWYFIVSNISGKILLRLGRSYKWIENNINSWLYKSIYGLKSIGNDSENLSNICIIFLVLCLC